MACGPRRFFRTRFRPPGTACSPFLLGRARARFEALLRSEKWSGLAGHPSDRADHQCRACFDRRFGSALKTLLSRETPKTLSMSRRYVPCAFNVACTEPLYPDLLSRRHVLLSSSTRASAANWPPTSLSAQDMEPTTRCWIPASIPSISSPPWPVSVTLSVWV
jgi:hypothetical protein